MSEFDLLGAEDVVGFDYMQLLSGAGGLLSGAGGMFSGGGGGAQPAAAAAAEKQRLEEEKRKAEASARNMKIALGVTGGVFALGLGAFLLSR
jgi:hypothetical protein